MKGTIVRCLQEMVTEMSGVQAWQQTLVGAKIKPTASVHVNQDIDDDKIMKVFRSASNTLDMPISQMLDEFGSYWSNSYAPRTYRGCYQNFSSAKEFLTASAGLHLGMIEAINNQQPAEFSYETKGSHAVVVHYGRSKPLMDLLPSMIMGVGKYFNEQLRIFKLGQTSLHVQFGALT